MKAFRIAVIPGDGIGKEARDRSGETLRYISNPAAKSKFGMAGFQQGE
jgi:isocitrate/isopropylmalate dehydrogenase